MKTTRKTSRKHFNSKSREPADWLHVSVLYENKDNPRPAHVFNNNENRLQGTYKEGEQTDYQDTHLPCIGDLISP